MGELVPQDPDDSEHPFIVRNGVIYGSSEPDNAPRRPRLRAMGPPVIHDPEFRELYERAHGIVPGETVDSDGSGQGTDLPADFPLPFVQRRVVEPMDPGEVSSGITDPNFRRAWDEFHGIVPGEVAE